ncbi:ribosomal protein S18-alanine N-acetyltransferase [Halodesulfovibrio marinisediminis]|uniref:Ribosomal-protein-alanine N-acetyltransferase n=1 Tax=Halodesulfovibrio marinisediminis DSM 17456 TaxID=1121457 RepID=A0A1N6E2G1_9BACT|nr:ribosomal protein S18-alanine N-acetyltransferase [Halodesulfovibrio marinisediminis]SIN77157.1 ribosomal-protein-alanine N-acetyltransferase [Halodesulfovibrio marinisediminis DSM 17456]
MSDIFAKIGPLEADGYVFFRLEKKDSAEVAALEKKCFSTPWTEKEFSLSFDQNIFEVFGLKKDDTLVAYIAMYHTADELEILNIATDPELRRKGAGKRLLGLMLCIGQKLGIQHAFLEVRRTNIPAINLYEQMCFKQIGVRKKYYKDTGEDALLYRCDLAALSECPC